MKKAVVTGANGFVGSWLVKCLSENGFYTYAVVRNPREDMTGISSLKGVNIVYCELDQVSELAGSIKDREIDLFYNLAWSGTAGNDRTDTCLQLKNAQWTVDCIRAAKDLGCKRFIGAGSIMEQETYLASSAQGNRPGLAYIYGAGKLAAHCMSKAVAADIGIDHAWAMITNAYGEGEFSPRFINTTIRKIINNEPLTFTAATQLYDFVHVKDVARALYLIGLNGKPFCEYIIGSSSAAPLKNFILKIKNTLAPEKDFQFGSVPFTGIDLPLSSFDCSTTEKDTGFKAEISFENGVKALMEWIVNLEGKK